MYCRPHSHFNFCADCFAAGKAELLQKMTAGRVAKRAGGAAIGAAPARKIRKRAKGRANKLRKVHDATVGSFIKEATFQGLGPDSNLQFFGYFAVTGTAGGMEV